jgi:uncharacterized protein YndB with AHSA1/START domain
VPLQNVAPLEAATDIAADPATVWALVSDVRNMPRWSPQTAKTFVRGGEVRVGARMVNINRRGLMVWPTQAEIVRFEPQQEIAWRVKENFTVWSYRLEPAGSGTRLTVRREAPQGISDVSVGLTKVAFGGVDSFAEELLRGMNRTLAGIKADAER